MREMRHECGADYKQGLRLLSRFVPLMEVIFIKIMQIASPALGLVVSRWLLEHRPNISIHFLR